MRLAWRNKRTPSLCSTVAGVWTVRLQTQLTDIQLGGLKTHTLGSPRSFQSHSATSMNCCRLESHNTPRHHWHCLWLKIPLRVRLVDSPRAKNKEIVPLISDIPSEQESSFQDTLFYKEEETIQQMKWCQCREGVEQFNKSTGALLKQILAWRKSMKCWTRKISPNSEVKETQSDIRECR